MRLTSTAAAAARVVMEGPVKTGRMASIHAPALLDTLASIVNSWTTVSPLPAAIKPPAWSITDIPPCHGQLQIKALLQISFSECRGRLLLCL